MNTRVFSVGDAVRVIMPRFLRYRKAIITEVISFDGSADHIEYMVDFEGNPPMKGHRIDQWDCVEWVEEGKL